MMLPFDRQNRPFAAGAHAQAVETVDSVDVFHRPFAFERQPAEELVAAIFRDQTVETVDSVDTFHRPFAPP